MSRDETIGIVVIAAIVGWLWYQSRSDTVSPASIQGGANPICPPRAAGTAIGSGIVSSSQALVCHVTGSPTDPISGAPLPSTASDSATQGAQPVNTVETVQLANQPPRISMPPIERGGPVPFVPYCNGLVRQPLPVIGVDTLNRQAANCSGAPSPIMATGASQYVTYDTAAPACPVIGSSITRGPTSEPLVSLRSGVDEL
jgi:hypothetical protein